MHLLPHVIMMPFALRHLTVAQICCHNLSSRRDILFTACSHASVQLLTALNVLVWSRSVIMDITETPSGRAMHIERESGEVMLCSGTLERLLIAKAAGAKCACILHRTGS